MSGREIKRRLEDNDLTQKWLMRQIHRSGYAIDYTRLSHILNEQVQGGNTDKVIELADTIIRQYSSSFGNARISWIRA